MVGDLETMEGVDASRRKPSTGRDLTRGTSGGEERIAVEPLGRGIADRLTTDHPDADPGINGGAAAGDPVLQREGAVPRVLGVEVGMIAAAGKGHAQHLVTALGIESAVVGEEGQRVADVGLGDDGHWVNASESCSRVIEVCRRENCPVLYYCLPGKPGRGDGDVRQ